MTVRAIRGATTIKTNSEEEIISKTIEVLEIMVKKNEIDLKDIISVFFTVTDGINAVFPAVAARKLGWELIPLLCTREINVPGSLTNCIRILIHLNTEKKQEELKHIYLHEAKKLRPDLSE